MKERKGFLYYFVRNRNGMIGMIGVLLILLIGLVGPMLIAKPDMATRRIFFRLPALCTGWGPTTLVWIFLQNWSGVLAPRCTFPLWLCSLPA